PEGNYSLRAYTTAMYGLSHDFFFKKDIFIASPVKAENKAYKHSVAQRFRSNDEVLPPLSAEWKNDTLRVTRNSRDTLPQYLLIHTRGIVQYLEEWKWDTKTLLFPKQNFSSGVLQVVLLDNNYSPLGQKMLPCVNDDHAHLNFLVENKDNLLQIKFILTDNHNKNISGNFSVSVTDDNLTLIDTTKNIRDYLLFHSDFVTDETWKRYNIPQIIKGKMDKLPGFIEWGQAVSGKVKNIGNKKAVPDAQVNILSLQTMYATSTTTDKNGIFSFNGMDFPDKTEFVVQAYKAKGKNNVALTIDEDNFPTVDSIDWPVRIDSTIIEQAKQYNRMYDNIKTIQLAEVVIKGKKTKKPANPYAAMADISFDSEKISNLNATCVHELLRRIAGLQVIGDNVIIRGASSIYGKSFAAIAVDGVILESMNEDGTATSQFDLDVIDLFNVERVDIFKSGNSVIWGARGGNGVISFTTKKGNFDYSKIEEVRYNTKVIKPLGYVLPAKFSQQAHSPLIYWNPNVNTDETGETSIAFSIPATKGYYSVIVQGVTNDGLIIYKAGEIVCKDL
ncbi:MAG: TonB-dependent receptor plug domain-containing protein, partial [Dysgonamonadaceae bacterium]|nr:TonB-dependent receptor plug domain-containing protein [Dysgonamonadaceae bacterium]